MPAHIVVASITAHPGREARLEAVLAGLVAPSRAEAGCLRYDLHRRVDDPATFVFLEAWESPQAHAAHKETPHFQAARREQEGLVLRREARILEPLG